MTAKVAWYFLPLIALSTTSVCAAPQSNLPKSPGLQLTLHTDKVVYHLQDTISYEIIVRNISGKDLYLFEPLGPDCSESLALSIKELRTGRRYTVWLGSDPPPPPPGSKADYSRLPPNEQCRTKIASKLSEYVDEPGQYELMARYQSPIESGSALSFNLPMWGREKGIILSSPITITVNKN